MIPGYTKQPVPSKRIWTTTFLDRKTECFEIMTYPNESTYGMATLYHKEYAIGTALADFLHTDLSAWERQKEELRASVAAINRGDNPERHFRYLFSCTQFWLSQSALFTPLAASIERLHLHYEKGEALSLDQCSAQMEYYRKAQETLKTVMNTVLETEESTGLAKKYLDLQTEQHFPILTYEKVRYQCVDKGANGFFPYDDFLNEVQKSELEEVITEVLDTEDAESLVHFVLARYLQENVHFRVCKYCEKYFGITGNSKAEYCERLIAGSRKTCKEMGSLRLYEKRKFESPAVREYKRSYKAHNARIRYGLMTREEFNTWAVEARQKRDACVDGKLSLQDFIAWLDSDKMS